MAHYKYICPMCSRSTQCRCIGPHETVERLCGSRICQDRLLESLKKLTKPDHWDRPPSQDCWCGDPPVHGCWCRTHAPRCPSGAHFYGNCYCKGI